MTGWIGLLVSVVVLLTAGAIVVLVKGAPGWALFILSADMLVACSLGLAVSVAVKRCGVKLASQMHEVALGNRESVELESGDPARVVADAYNATMAAHRERREIEQAQLAHAQQAARSLLESLPLAVALISPGGQVELANAPAQRLGLVAGGVVNESQPKIIGPLVEQVRTTGKAVELDEAARGAHLRESLVQVFEGGQERFYRPHVHPVVLDGLCVGITVVLLDVTGEQQLEEARGGLLSAVSHQLKTPMTSIQMSVHLLLEDAVNRLTPRQTELLQAARDDADRLQRLIEELLTAALKPVNEV